MMDILQFTFQSFWHFAGMAILLSIAVYPLTAFFIALGSRK